MSVEKSDDISILDGLSSFVFVISAYKSYCTPNFYWKLTNTILILSSLLCNVYKSNAYYLFFDYAVIYAISTTYIISQNIPSSLSPYMKPHITTIYVSQHPFTKCTLLSIFIFFIYYYCTPVYDVFLLMKEFLNIMKNTSVVFSFYLCSRKIPIMYVICPVALICYGVKRYVGQHMVNGTDSDYYRMYIIYYWTTWLWHLSIATILYFSSNNLRGKGRQVLTV